MNPAQLPQLCPGCFQPQGSAAVCPHCGFDENQRPAIALPYRTLLNGGQYLTGRVLGKPGGFGITYLALDTQLEDLVAIKEYLPRDFAAREGSSLSIRPHSAEDGEAFQHWREKFMEEAKAVARFKHPHIVRVRYVFQEHGTAYLVMDYLEGQALNEFLHNHVGPLAVADSLDIMLPVLDALEFVHRNNMIHRDVKPQNLYRTTDGKTILLDFGAARPTTGGRNKLTAIWSEGYAALEQCDATRQGPWTDVYACAAVLYEMTTGTKPPSSTLRAIAETLRDPREINPTLSAEFASALLNGLAIKAGQRTQDIAAFRRALTTCSQPIVDDDKTRQPDGKDRRGVENRVGLEGRQETGKPNVARTKPRSGEIREVAEGTAQSPRPPGFRPEGFIRATALPDRKDRLGFKNRVGLLSVGLAAVLAVVGWPVVIEWIQQHEQERVAEVKHQAELVAQRLEAQREKEQEDKRIAELEAQRQKELEAKRAAELEALRQVEAELNSKMVRIPAGEYMMGAADGEAGAEANEKPRHEVKISTFSLGQYEVTQKQWRAVMGSNPSKFRQCGGDCPVEEVSFNNVQEFLKKVNDKTGKTYRLPTEAEWEYAARAGTTTPFFTGNCINAQLANFNGTTDYNGCGAKTDVYLKTPKPVGSYPANPWGLYDMAGNVWEWTCSAYTEWYDGSEKSCTNNDNIRRVIRGGSWYFKPADLRSANRGANFRDYSGCDLGFRLAQD